MESLELERILRGDDFLRSFGVLSDFQKNNLVLTTLCACPKLKNVKFEVNSQTQSIDAVLYVGQWFYWFGNRKRIIETLTSLYLEYIPTYTVRLKFEKYARSSKK